MKRPTEFWATVLFASVIVYMTHDAYGSRPQGLTHTDIQIEDIEVEDARAFEPAGVYTEWQSTITQHTWEQPQACSLYQSDWPCMQHNGCV